ncbi:hypothetical protein C4K10_5744 [Pseudomonas chlororaphis subsp. aureofaciens]|nr:hypothetical protein C4K10_5744 [Pseudomonas chlororaphis subsp. aureofaciens]
MWGFYGGSVESVWRLALWEAAGAFFQVNRGFRVCGRYTTDRSLAGSAAATWTACTL